MESSPRAVFTRLREAGSLAAKGFCMGTADIIPGVSGGTMAFILGIYPQLLRAIASFDLPWLAALVRLRLAEALTRPHLPFLVPLGTGIVAAVLFFTRVVPLPELVHTHPELVYGLFFGLIAGSIVVLLSRYGVPGAGGWTALALGIAAGWVVVNLVPASTPENAAFVFLSGMLAICAMILPGVSGSFILLILGKYAYVLDGLARLDWGVIVPFALGAIVGLTAFVRVLGWVFRTWRTLPVVFINGFLIGSLWMVWPFQDRRYVMVHDESRLVQSTPVWPPGVDEQVLGAFALLAAGACAVLVIDRLARRRTRASSAA